MKSRDAKQYASRSGDFVDLHQLRLLRITDNETTQFRGLPMAFESNDALLIVDVQRDSSRA